MNALNLLALASAQLPSPPDDLARLESSGLLDRVLLNNQHTLRVRVPCEIRIAPNIAGEIVAATPRIREGGGLLGARPLFDNGQRVLSIEKLTVVKNVSKSPRRSYLPDGRGLRAALHDLVESDCLVPISYHTHPAPKGTSMGCMTQYYSQMGSSEADQSLALEVAVCGATRIALPQAIIIRDPTRDGLCMMGVYGGLAAPLDFMSSIHSAGASAAVDIVDGVAGWFSSPDGSQLWKTIAGLSIGAVLVACLTRPKLLIGVLLGLMVLTAGALPLAQSEAGHVMHYFGVVSSHTGTHILLPGPAPASPVIDKLARSITVRTHRARRTGRRGTGA
jgi:hypothetical protein